MHDGERSCLLIGTLEPARRELDQWPVFKLLHQSWYLVGGSKHESVLRHIQLAILARPRIDLSQPKPMHMQHITSSEPLIDTSLVDQALSHQDQRLRLPPCHLPYRSDAESVLQHASARAGLEFGLRTLRPVPA